MKDLQPLTAARTRSVSGLEWPIGQRGPQGDGMRRSRATRPFPSARSLLNSGGTRLGGRPARREAAPHRASPSQRYFGREPMPAFDAAGLRCGRGVKRIVLPSQGRNRAVDCQPPPAASRRPRPCPALRREAPCRRQRLCEPRWHDLSRARSSSRVPGRRALRPRRTGLRPASRKARRQAPLRRGSRVR